MFSLSSFSRFAWVIMTLLLVFRHWRSYHLILRQLKGATAWVRIKRAFQGFTGFQHHQCTIQAVAQLIHTPLLLTLDHTMHPIRVSYGHQCMVVQILTAVGIILAFIVSRCIEDSRNAGGDHSWEYSFDLSAIIASLFASGAVESYYSLWCLLSWPLLAHRHIFYFLS